MVSVMPRRRTGVHHVLAAANGGMQGARRWLVAVAVAATLATLHLVATPPDAATPGPQLVERVAPPLVHFVSVDDADVLPEAALEGYCRAEPFAPTRNHGDVLSECVELCRSMDACHAATFVPMRAYKVAPSVEGCRLPIHTFAEQNALVGACTHLLCGAASAGVLRELAGRLHATGQWRQHRRHVVAPTTFVKGQSPLLHAFGGPPGIAAPRNIIAGGRPHEAGHGVHMHFLMLSAPAYVHRRVVPALRTWLQGQHVSIFLDEEGDGKEAHQRMADGEASSAAGGLSITAASEAVQRVAQRGRTRCTLYALSAAPVNDTAISWVRRRSLNGAWKPLAILLFLDRVLQDNGAAGQPNAIDGRQWLMLLDDDTFVVLPNLMWHVQELMLSSQRRRAASHDHNRRNGTSGGVRIVEAEAVAMGAAGRYSLVMSQRNYVRPASSSSSSNYSTALDHGMQRLDYLQGGGGIVGTHRFFSNLRGCLTTLGVFDDAKDDDPHRALSDFDGAESNDTELFDAFTLRRVGVASGTSHRGDGASQRRRLARGFADAWPAGDMRLAWAVAQCNAFYRATPPVRAERGAPWSPLLLVDNAAFSHRSLELSLGADRRHWMTAFPATFHRCRTPKDFERLQYASSTAPVESDALLHYDNRMRSSSHALPPPKQQPLDRHHASPLISWRAVEGNTAQWWQQRCGASTGDEVNAETIHDLFFNDGGFA